MQKRANKIENRLAGTQRKEKKRTDTPGLLSLAAFVGPSEVAERMVLRTSDNFTGPKVHKD
jgi:hypothetical protein